MQLSLFCFEIRCSWLLLLVFESMWLCCCSDFIMFWLVSLILGGFLGIIVYVISIAIYPDCHVFCVCLMILIDYVVVLHGCSMMLMIFWCPYCMISYMVSNDFDVPCFLCCACYIVCLDGFSALHDVVWLSLLI